MNSLNSKKVSYEEPRLLVHGSMAQIVQTNEVCNLQDALGVPPPIVGSEYGPPVCK